MPTSCQRCPGHAWIFFRSHFLLGSQVFLAQFTKCRNGLHGIHSIATDVYSHTGMTPNERPPGEVTRAADRVHATTLRHG